VEDDTDMADTRCTSCGRTVPADVPLGLCPECLMRSGFATGTAPGAGSGRGFVPPTLDELRALFLQLEILELIGRGGMGAVYKARQPGLDRLVALKILPAAISGDPGFAERFNREARLLARLQHPRIVTIHDFGVTGSGMHYLLMEYVDGPTLRQVQRSGRLTPAQALRIVPEICEALQFAHDRGVVHRDIKPENVLLDQEGHVKITDFGIAKMVGPDAETTALTGGVDVVGTPHYMAPEQIEHPLDVDHRADIYSLGVVFYELLTGELPLGRFAAPSQRVQVDVRLDEVILRTLEKEPARRYQQVSEVKTRVDTIAGTPPPVQDRVRRHPPMTALLAALLYAPQAVLLLLVDHLLWGGIGPAFWGFGSPLGRFGVPQVTPALFPAVMLHLLALVVAYAAWGAVHYSCWTVLPERYRRTTPGRAVGLLFVPGFNFYWAFVSLGRLAAGFQAWGEDHPGRPIAPASGLAIAKAASFVAYWTIAWLPGLVSIVSVADAVLFWFYYRAVVDNANRVIASEAGAPLSGVAV
jgi:predicted Ser/Thr protein kinase